MRSSYILQGMSASTGPSQHRPLPVLVPEKAESLVVPVGLELAARALGTTPRAIKRLQESEHLRELDLATVSRLAAAERLHVAPGHVQPVVRQGPPSYDEAERRPLGESWSYTSSEVLAASSGRWRIALEVAETLALLPVAVSGFIVRVLVVHGLQEVRRVEKLDGTSYPVVTFAADLGGTAQRLGWPRADDVDPRLPEDVAESVRAMLHRRSTGIAGGPVAYLAEVQSRQPPA